MPDNYFSIRLAIEEAPAAEGFDRLIRLAVRALDAGDWAALRRVGEDAIARRPCQAWQRRIEDLLTDPVFRGSVSG